MRIARAFTQGTKYFRGVYLDRSRNSGTDRSRGIARRERPHRELDAPWRARAPIWRCTITRAARLGAACEEARVESVPCTSAVIVLRADGPDGFYVLTTYPEARE